MSIQPKNLEQKVAILLEDIERVSESEKIRRVTRFVIEQMEWKDQDLQIDDYDLAEVKSLAVHLMTNFPTSKVREYGWDSSYDNDKQRTLCWVESVVGFLRGKRLIPFTVSFSTKKGRR